MDEILFESYISFIQHPRIHEWQCFALQLLHSVYLLKIFPLQARVNECSGNEKKATTLYWGKWGTRKVLSTDIVWEMSCVPKNCKHLFPSVAKICFTFSSLQASCLYWFPYWCFFWCWSPKHRLHTSLCSGNDTTIPSVCSLYSYSCCHIFFNSTKADIIPPIRKPGAGLWHST